MKRLVANLILMLVWAAMTGSIAPLDLLFGFALGALALFIVREQRGEGGYVVRPLRILPLILLFLKELALSAIRVAVLVVQPRMKLKPGIFAYPLTLTSDFEIALLANLITLTPGTLSVDVSTDRKTLYVHALDCSNPTATRSDIATGFERRIREAFGP